LLKGWLLRRAWSILIAGGLVGALGWFMVASGLQDRPDVSHYRLAIHLSAAFTVFCLVLWTILDIRSGRRSLAGNGTAAARWTRGAMVLLALQIVWGAFTAGMDAGYIYNTWPLMNGSFMPDNVLAHGDPWVDLTDHRDGVQFMHRNLAWLVAAVVVFIALRYRRHLGLSSTAPWLLVAVSVQFLLGVLTVLTQVHIVLGVLHQFGALALLAVLIVAVHRTGRLVTAPSPRLVEQPALA